MIPNITIPVDLFDNLKAFIEADGSIKITDDEIHCDAFILVCNRGVLKEGSVQDATKL